MCKVVKLAYRKRIFVNLRNKFQFSNKVCVKITLYNSKKIRNI